MASSIFIWPGVSSSTGGGGASFAGAVTAGSAATGSFRAADGTALLPAYSFTSEPTLGFWRSAANTVTLQGAFVAVSGITSMSSITAGTGGTNEFRWLGTAEMGSPGNGLITMLNATRTAGVQFKVDNLPTVSAGGGTSPAVTAGSTPLSGSVNVGSGVPGATITIAYGGTAFPSAPFPVCMNQTTGLAVKATSTTTHLTITPAIGNFGASDVISWVVIGSK